MKKLLLALLLSTSVHAGKAIIVKGDVEAEYVGKTVKLKKGDNVKVGTVITTKKGSFVKILFRDKASIVVAPNSVAKIESYKRGQPGLINLIKGQIRAKVQKNLLGKQGKVKFMVKTPTAAMGVRGTEFQVNYYDKTKRTALVTISGEVMMIKVPKHIKNVRRLRKWLSKKTAVSVKKGEYSTVTPGKPGAEKPTKIDPVQLNKLQRYELPGTAKKFRDVDPGVEGFVGDVKIEKKNKVKPKPRIDFKTGDIKNDKFKSVKIDPNKIKQIERKGVERRTHKISERTQQDIIDKIERKEYNDRETKEIIGRGRVKLLLKLRRR